MGDVNSSQHPKSGIASHAQKKAVLLAAIANDRTESRRQFCCVERLVQVEPTWWRVWQGVAGHDNDADILLLQIADEIPRHLTSQIDVNYGRPRPLCSEKSSCLERCGNWTRDVHAQVFK
jgi:hypothetical protein